MSVNALGSWRAKDVSWSRPIMQLSVVEAEGYRILEYVQKAFVGASLKLFCRES